MFRGSGFYSPLVDTDDLRAREDQIWTGQPRDVIGVDFNDRSHLKILKRWFPRQMPKFDYPASRADEQSEHHFYTQNHSFEMLDPRLLFVMLNELAPRRVIEIGAGMSTLLTADVNTRFLGGSCDFKSVDPYRPEYLRELPSGCSELVAERVEKLPLAFFEPLRAGDFLFIDSSHVAKTGSDLNYLVFEVLPRLRKGVFVHFHDIFLPFEYHKSWVIEEGRSWNEQYLLRSLLMWSSRISVVFAAYYAFWRFRDQVIASLANPDGAGYGGGSFWIHV